MSNDWTTKRLGDICETIYSGGTPNTSEEKYWNGDLNWLSSGETRSRYIRKTEKFITQLGVDNSSTRKAKAGDIVVASAGQGLTRGQASYCVIETYINQSIIAIRTNRNVLHPLFLLYNLLNRYDELRSLSDASSTRGSLTCNIMKGLFIVFPTLPTQIKIATILSAYDNLIENNLRRIKILEEMAQNLYREWFVKFRFPGHQKARFVNSPLGKIPEGWEVDTVEHAFSIIGGGTPSKNVSEYWKNGTINWFSPTDLTATNSMFMDYSGIQISELGLKKSSAQIFPPFSVMMTSRATLGVISINTTEACTNQGFISCIPNERFPLYTLYYWLKENVEYFISLGTGATFKEITKGVFKTIKLVVPAKTIVARFEDIVQQFALQVFNMQRKNINLRRTRDLLLPKLISGELDVSDLDIAVPEEAA